MMHSLPTIDHIMCELFMLTPKFEATTRTSHAYINFALLNYDYLHKISNIKNIYYRNNYLTIYILHVCLNIKSKKRVYN